MAWDRTQREHTAKDMTLILACLFESRSQKPRIPKEFGKQNETIQMISPWIHMGDEEPQQRAERTEASAQAQMMSWR